MISKPNIDLNKPIKSRTVRTIAAIVLAVLIITLGIGIFTNKIDHIWGIGFNTEKKDTLPKIENQNINNGDIQIGTHNGDILTDSSVKVVNEK